MLPFPYNTFLAGAHSDTCGTAGMGFSSAAHPHPTSYAALLAHAFSSENQAASMGLTDGARGTDGAHGWSPSTFKLIPVSTHVGLQA